MNILATIKKISLRRMIIPLAICGLTIATILFFPFRTILNPPVISDLWNNTSVLSSEDYVEITMDKLSYTGYDITTFTNKKYGYYYSLNNERCMFFLVPIGDAPNMTLRNYTVKGAVISKKSSSSYSQMVESLATDIDWNSNSLDKATVSYIISSANYHPLLFIIAMAVLFFIFAFELYQFAHELRRYFNPYAYPLCPHITVDNKEAYVNDVHKQVESHLLTQQEDLYLTEKFLVEYNSKKIIAVPLSTVIWSYRMGTLNYRISHHTPKYNLYIVLLTGESIVFENKSSESCRIILEELRVMNRDIILGYTDAKRRAAKKLTKEYNKNKNNKGQDI